ncbi:lysine-specific demethylase 3B-like [Limulus polyphemus]|uniref:Lysine-specific demethylase 3B-like n=1 Tax=Limulus polyphemus TaxID=6850 RepID=A0ABM1SLX8_LIMPO|nr:lysine-specific demethylase 3B-like [Limulus polyphemus]
MDAEANRNLVAVDGQMRKPFDRMLSGKQYQEKCGEQQIQQTCISLESSRNTAEIKPEIFKQTCPTLEHNFNLFGYQAFQQMCITPAELKAKEESQNILAPSTSTERSTGFSARRDHFTSAGSNNVVSSEGIQNSLYLKQTVKCIPEKPGSSHQTLFGRKEACMPYHYSFSSSSPSHQNTVSTSCICTSQYTSSFKNQSQNLVNQVKPTPYQKHRSPKSQSSVLVSTQWEGCYISAKINAPISATALSNSLIQAGLMPNPIYAASQLHSTPMVETQSPTVVHSCQQTVSSVIEVSTTSLCKVRSMLNVEPYSQVTPVYSKVSSVSETQTVDCTSFSSVPSVKKAHLNSLAWQPPSSSMLPVMQSLNVFKHSLLENKPSPSFSTPGQAKTFKLKNSTVIDSDNRITRDGSYTKQQKSNDDMSLVSFLQPLINSTSARVISTVSIVTTQHSSSFMDSFCSFVNSSQKSLEESSYTYSKGRHKIKPTVASSKNLCDRYSSTSSSTTGPGQALDSDTETRVTPSPALSTCTNYSTSSGGSISTNYTNLEKAWLQRRTEDEDVKCVGTTKLVENPEVKLKTLKLNSPVVSVNYSVHSVMNIKTSEDEPSIKETILIKTSTNNFKINDNPAVCEENLTNFASETEHKNKIHISRKRRLYQEEKESRQKKVKQKGGSVQENAEDGDTNKKTFKETGKQGKRGRQPKEQESGSDCQKKKICNSFENALVVQLKRIGEPFLQNGPCCEVAPKLPKCRECRMTPHQRSKKMKNIFCRFYAFRKLKCGKNGAILSAGFSQLADASKEDLRLWIPSADSPPNYLDLETAKFLLTHVGDQFCDLVDQEQEAKGLHMSNNKAIMWKRVVQGVREMCDVCETTLFNIHWVCRKCGFAVCIDCYKARKNGTVKEEECSSKDRDEYQWLLCKNRQPHEQDKLMLTQIIVDTALWDVGKKLHKIREQWNITACCKCHQNSKNKNIDRKRSNNGICKQLMSAVTKCFTEKCPRTLKSVVVETNTTCKPSSMNAISKMVKKEEYGSASGGSLNWLADVALNTSSDLHKEGINEGSSSIHHDADIDEQSTKDDTQNNNFSTLRNLLIRPNMKNNNENRNKVKGFNSEKKTLASGLEEVISCVIQQHVVKADKPNQEQHQLKYFVRRYPKIERGIGQTTIRVLTLAESLIMHPNVPHSWLCSGRLLLLHDAQHKDNLHIFQEQWKRGQPVMVLNVSSKLNMTLWYPESFSRDFGDVKNDLVNCKTGTILPNLPMRKFWYGFENFSSSAAYSQKGTTNLHLDISDAVNVMVYVGIPKDGKNEDHIQEALKAIEEGGCDVLTQKRVREKGMKPGALWHIYNAKDADKIRDLLNKVALEQGEKPEAHHDPIHDQSWYLDKDLRNRLYKEYSVEGYAIVQCLGDSVFIPAGAPHQVRNLHSCIKVAEDFVSPENIAYCFTLTQEFRDLTDTHTNHEDKLQIKNIIYHTVKDAVSLLERNEADKKKLITTSHANDLRM